MQMTIEFDDNIFCGFSDQEIRSAQILHWVVTADSDDLFDNLQVLLYNEEHKLKTKSGEVILWYIPPYVELLNRCEDKEKILKEDLDEAEELRRKFEEAHDDDEEYQINW